MLNILAAIFVFGMIVLIHEFGHFLLAKANGIGVVEFSIGMGPRLCSFTKGETRYSVKVLPFGGSCMMIGEDGEDADPRAFNNKSVWARIAVIAAGPGFNLILAFLAAMVIVAQVGHDGTELVGVIDGYPAKEAGLQAGDRITHIGNRRVAANRDISTWLYTHPGEEVTIRYERPAGGTWESGGAAERRVAVLTPVFSDQYQSYMLGLQFEGFQRVNSVGAFLRCSLYEVKYCVTSTVDSFGMLVRRQIRADEAFAGPVQIVSMVGETVGEGREAGTFAVIYVIANWILLLSTSLGIMNLLPIPALDGGRLLFLLIELVRGKPIDPEREGQIHTVGLMLLMALMVLILFNDVRKLM